MKKQRQSNFELLRIISIILIISFHYVYKSNFIITDLNANNYMIKIFWLLGEVGVNLFVLISGYFMIKGKFNCRKILLLFGEVIFYNLLNATLLKITTGTIPILSLIYSPYWFVRMYIILYLLSPYINRLINNISKREYQHLLLICIVIWSILPTILGITVNSTENFDFYCRMIWFIIMYLIGGYIKLYGIKFLEKRKNALICFIILAVILFSSIGIINYIKLWIPKLNFLELAYLWCPNNIITLLLSVSLFELFVNFNIGCNKMINKISSTTLGIYMLHDGKFASYLWVNIFHTKSVLSSKYPILGIIGAVIIIFIFGIIIDLVRQGLENHILKKYLNSHKMDILLNKIIYKCNQILDNYI